MPSTRAALFEDDEIDLSGFKPELTPDSDLPAKDVVKAVSEQAGFISREVGDHIAKLSTNIDDKKASFQTKRKPYNASESQKVQLNIRVAQNVVDAFYKIARDNEWTLGQTLRKAVLALEKDIFTA